MDLYELLNTYNVSTPYYNDMFATPDALFDMKFQDRMQNYIDYMESHINKDKILAAIIDDRYPKSICYKYNTLLHFEIHFKNIIPVTQSLIDEYELDITGRGYPIKRAQIIRRKSPTHNVTLLVSGLTPYLAAKGRKKGLISGPHYIKSKHINSAIKNIVHIDFRHRNVPKDCM
jgi:hypothetical protein